MREEFLEDEERSGLMGITLAYGRFGVGSEDLTVPLEKLGKKFQPVLAEEFREWQSLIHSAMSIGMNKWPKLKTRFAAQKVNQLCRSLALVIEWENGQPTGNIICSGVLQAVIATLHIDALMRIRETLYLEWADITLAPINGIRFGFLRVRDGKSKNARCVIPLTDRAASMLQERLAARASDFVFANRDGKPYLSTSINHLHRNAVAPKGEGKRRPLFPTDFVLHSLRHTMFTRLGEWGVDAFTIMRIAGHSSVVVSQ